MRIRSGISVSSFAIAIFTWCFRIFPLNRAGVCDKQGDCNASGLSFGTGGPAYISRLKVFAGPFQSGKDSRPPALHVSAVFQSEKLCLAQFGILP